MVCVSILAVMSGKGGSNFATPCRYPESKCSGISRRGQVRDLLMLLTWNAWNFLSNSAKIMQIGGIRPQKLFSSFILKLNTCIYDGWILICSYLPWLISTYQFNCIVEGVEDQSLINFKAFLFPLASMLSDTSDLL